MSRHGRQKSISIQLEPEAFSRSSEVRSVLTHAQGLSQAWSITCERCLLKGLQPVENPFVFLTWKNASKELRPWALQMAHEATRIHGKNLKPLTRAQVEYLHAQHARVEFAVKALGGTARAVQPIRMSTEALSLLHGGLDEGDPLYWLAEQAYSGQLA